MSDSRLHSRRRFLAGAASSLAGMIGCARGRNSSAEGRRVLTVWHNWGGVQSEPFARVIQIFERAHPGVTVRALFTRNDLSSNQKFFTAVAADNPPDVTFVDGPQVASWAEWGAIVPLDDRIQGDGIDPSDYFPPTWQQNVYKGRVWAMTYCADPNFGWVWNKEIFRKAGLDPERPPVTIDELTEMADRTTIVEGSVIRQLGVIPWEQYGSANSMFTWGWVFGGDFYDPATRKIMADHPKVVNALEWMSSFARKMDPSRVQSIRDLVTGAADQDPFYSGRMAMRCLHISGLNDIQRFAPKLDYGVTFIPAPPDGEAHSSWVGGWCMAIPRGCKQPDLAWQFIRWMCYTAEGTTTAGREQRLFPGCRRSPFFKEAKSKPHYGDYVRILEESRHQRPVMPAQALYMREMQRAVDAAVFGRKTPRQALVDARKNTQAELDLVLAG